MSLFTKLKERAKDLKKNLVSVYYLSRDDRVGFLPKAIIVFTVLYALSPIDLIPDFIPVLGYLDDLIILPALIALTIRLVPKEVWEDARAKATSEPLRLKKNWTFGVVFVMVWLVVVWLIAKNIYDYIH